MKITNITTHWHVKNIASNITITVGSDSLVFQTGFWDFESIKKHLKTKNVVLEELSHSNTCSLFHASEDVALGNLAPYLGFALNTTISANTTTLSPNTVNIFKGLTYVEIKSEIVDRNTNLDQGFWSTLLTRIPIDTKQVLNGSISTYQPWSTSPCFSRLVPSLEFEVKDNSTLTNPYTLYVEIDIF